MSQLQIPEGWVDAVFKAVDLECPTPFQRYNQHRVLQAILPKVRERLAKTLMERTAAPMQIVRTEGYDTGYADAIAAVWESFDSAFPPGEHS